MLTLTLTLPLLALLEGQPRELVTPVSPAPIIGGAPAEGEFPTVVAIVAPDADPGKQTLCSGALLDGQTVLTAAHCLLATSSSEDLEVILGDTSKTGDATLRRAVASFELHPQYRPELPPEQQELDFGLLTLREPLTGVAPIRPITSQREWDQLMTVGAQLTAVGFGARVLVEDGQPPPEQYGLKHHVNVPLQQLTPSGHVFVAGDTGRDVLRRLGRSALDPGCRRYLETRRRRGQQRRLRRRLLAVRDGQQRLTVGPRGHGARPAPRGLRGTRGRRVHRHRIAASRVFVLPRHLAGAGARRVVVGAFHRQRVSTTTRRGVRPEASSMRAARRRGFCSGAR